MVTKPDKENIMTHQDDYTLRTTLQKKDWKPFLNYCVS